MLAQMGTALDLRETVLASPQQRELRELNLARWTLVQDRIAAKNRLLNLRQPVLKRQCQARLRQIQRDLAALEANMNRLIQADPGLARKHVILTSVSGIGPTTAATVLAELPELGSLESKEVASLAGVAPMTRGSGTGKGRSLTQGRRFRLRRGLYMAALVASRHNPDLRTKYQQLLAAGKPSKVALTAIMRKLIILANTLVKQDRTWSPDHPSIRY